MVKRIRKNALIPISAHAFFIHFVVGLLIAIEPNNITKNTENMAIEQCNEDLIGDIQNSYQSSAGKSEVHIQ